MSIEAWSKNRVGYGHNPIVLRHYWRQFGSSDEWKVLAKLVDEMRKIGFVSQLLPVSLALSLAFALSSCAIFGVDDSSKKTLWEQDDQYIRIVPQDVRNALPNGHPVTLSSTQIKTVLGILEVNFQKKEKTFSTRTDIYQAIFTEEQIELLGDTLSRGLRKAGPRQDITFGLVGYYRIGLASFLKVRRVVTGRVFYHDERLNIIFGRLRGDYPEPKGAGAMVAIPPERDMTPGSRAVLKSGRWTIRSAIEIDLYESGDSARKDWVTIDPKEAVAKAEERMKRAQVEPKRAAQESQKLQEEATRLQSEQQALRDKVDQLEEELETVKQDRSQEGVTAAGVAAGATVGTTTSTNVASDAAPKTDAEQHTLPSSGAAVVSVPEAAATLEQQLKVLKRLRDQDLISEDVYRTRVEKLLDDAL